VVALKRLAHPLRVAGLVLATVAGLCAAPARAVEPHLPAAPDSVAGRALQAQTVGEDPATAWSWLRAWGQAFPDDHVAYRALRRGLVDQYLRQALGEPLATDTTLAALRDAGAALPPLEQDREAQARWAAALERGLVPLRAEAGPLPGEIEALASRLELLAPGLWLSRHPDGRARSLLWAQRVSVRGRVPLAPQALEVHLEAPGGRALVFDCPPERGQPAAVRPGDTWRLLCRSRGEPDERNPALRALVAALTRDGVAAWRWQSAELHRQGGLEAMIDALTAAVPDRTARFAQAHRPCELRSRCPIRVGGPVRPQAQADARAATAGWDIEPEPAWAAAPKPRQLAQGLAVLLAAFIVFCLVARSFGERVAAVLMLVLLLPLAWRFGSGFGTASVLLATGSVAAALLGTGAFLLAYLLYDALVFNRLAPRPVADRRRRRASS
jgi:hypothetical protein